MYQEHVPTTNVTKKESKEGGKDQESIQYRNRYNFRLILCRMNTRGTAKVDYHETSLSHLVCYY